MSITLFIHLYTKNDGTDQLQDTILVTDASYIPFRHSHLDIDGIKYRVVKTVTTIRSQIAKDLGELKVFKMQCVTVTAFEFGKK